MEYTKQEIEDGVAREMDVAAAINENLKRRKREPKQEFAGTLMNIVKSLKMQLYDVPKIATGIAIMGSPYRKIAVAFIDVPPDYPDLAENIRKAADREKGDVRFFAVIEKKCKRDAEHALMRRLENEYDAWRLAFETPYHPTQNTDESGQWHSGEKWMRVDNELVECGNCMHGFFDDYEVDANDGKHAGAVRHETVCDHPSHSGETEFSGQMPCPCNLEYWHPNADFKRRHVYRRDFPINTREATPT